MAPEVDLVSAPRALWRIAHPGRELTGAYLCAMCGGPSTDEYASHAVMADTFQRYDVFRRAESPYCCAACSWYLDATGQRTGCAPHPQFSRMSYVVHPDRWEDVTQDRVRELFTSWTPAPPHPIYMVLSRVKKKHLALLARPWMPGTHVTIQFEETPIVLPRAELDEIGRLVQALLDEGIGKRAIEAGALPARALRGHPDPARILALHQALSRWRPSPALLFASWIARTPDKEGTVHGSDLPQPRLRPGGRTAPALLALD